ncbi:15-cis-phytoene synthase CrtB [Halomonas sp. M20]|uniref:15-cis-phytoene synthase CrtB n=1 Tax=Halomonas sp. M20 TaxID=2763264 RepID=UPI001D0AF07C|nr:15-cis-phytoene synthase CrtB [Halomonas sp. M20]
MVDALDRHAAETIQVGSKSFATAARLFDPATRRSVLMLYAWCRHCDDVIDEQHLGMPSRVEGSTDSSEQRMAGLRHMTQQAYAGEPMQSPPFAAFQQVALNHRLPERYPLAHLEGFAMDVQERCYVTIDDTLSYCYHVAGVVGIMMAWIMGVRDEATLDRACDLGLAFQLTNIARDIVDDAEIARCYLPQTWLVEAGIPPEEIADPRHRDALAGVTARLIDLAEPYYQSARGGLGALPPRSAWAIATAHGVYREIGIQVKARGAGAWDRRVSTSKADKLRLLAKGLGQMMTSRWQMPAPRPEHLWQRLE